jgi:hypothetical protein
MKKTRLSQLFAYMLSLLLVITTMFLSGCGASIEPGPPKEILYVNRLWTTVGSDGTVDERDAGKVIFDRSAVQVGQFIGDNHPVALTMSETDSAVIRYNVTPADALFELRRPCEDPNKGDPSGLGCPGIGLQVRYLAAGFDARVVAKLIEVDMATGIHVDRLTLDSSSFPASEEYQVQSVGQCTPPEGSWRFNFRDKAYYIEATLIHSAIVASSAAGIQMIKITNDCPEGPILIGR